ncbi:hypothetical protein L4C37_02960 [Vibrio kagoshimensis]|uniref:hypothetical protein n=1 Tax=Vibrio kagoshimensis TaxID=2910244 RepID=UPI003D1E5EC5
MKRLILVMVIASALMGCMKSHDLDFLEEGKTTPKQLAEYLGEVSMVIDMGDTISYVYNYNLHQKAFTFENGVFILLEKITEVDGEYVFETMELH